ncbi:hypothetical protein E2C01_026036 [Portunus trituberculatus]|uniref:Uncharacterized protein n=1 Tax=Portunus trituberculatus TaxID=210409 RepID=A0A5B7EEF4_PORTR|nr:hypothetical protein [Portunus trituberculatus]
MVGTMWSLASTPAGHNQYPRLCTLDIHTTGPPHPPARPGGVVTGSQGATVPEVSAEMTLTGRGGQCRGGYPERAATYTSPRLTVGEGRGLLWCRRGHGQAGGTTSLLGTAGQRGTAGGGELLLLLLLVQEGGGAGEVEVEAAGRGGGGSRTP